MGFFSDLSSIVSDINETIDGAKQAVTGVAEELSSSVSEVGQSLHSSADDIAQLNDEVTGTISTTIQEAKDKLNNPLG